MTWVKTPKMHHPVLVKCGRCKACQQEKANHRTMRIRNNGKKGQISLFVTLTYQNKYIPYVRIKDVNDCYSFFDSNSSSDVTHLSVFRDYSCRRVRVSGKTRGQNYTMVYKDKKCDSPVFQLSVLRKDLEKLPISSLPDIQGRKGCLAVCYYKDLQDFFKRLRVNLQRRHDYKGDFSAYSCSEYGSRTSRAHFHVLLFIDSKDEALFRTAIREAWPYADWPRLPKSIQVAKDAASYVSSYVNRGADFPPFLELSAFRPKCSYSKAFGLDNVNFTLSAIQEKIRKRDITYNVATVTAHGIVQRSVLMPQYVINRYFPKFKGYSRLSTPEILSILRCPQRLWTIAKFCDYSPTDIRTFTIALENSYRRYIRELNLPDNWQSRDSYACNHVDCHRLKTMTLLRQWYLNPDNIPQLLLYDNWSWSYYNSDFRVSKEWSSFVDTQLKLNPKLKNYENPNTFPHYRMVDEHLSSLFDQKKKTRDVNNEVMRQSNSEF